MIWPFSRNSMPSRVRREVIRPTDGQRLMFEGRLLSEREVDALARRTADDAEHFSALFYGDPDAMRVEAERRAAAEEARWRRDEGLRALNDYARRFPMRRRPMSDPSQSWPGVVAPAESDVPTSGEMQ